jgi:hypothetical protein
VYPPVLCISLLPLATDKQQLLHCEDKYEPSIIRAYASERSTKKKKKVEWYMFATNYEVLLSQGLGRFSNSTTLEFHQKILWEKMTSQAQFHCHATVLISANPTFTMTAYYLS